MAHLLNDAYPLIPGIHEEELWKVSMHFQDEALDKIPKDRILRFSYADGYALYYVVDIEKAIIQHIPYGDAWEIPTDLLSGLTSRDIKERLHREARFYELLNIAVGRGSTEDKKGRKKDKNA